MRFLTKEKFNINYIVNFLFISTVFALLQNFGINENKYKLFYLSLGFLYFLTLNLKFKNIFLLINILLIVALINLSLFSFPYLFIQIFFLSIHQDFTRKYLKFKLNKKINLSNSVVKLFVPCILLFLTLLTQNAYLNFEVIDHDVSTSLVVSDDIFNGLLPYEDSWDDKQPLFYFFNFIVLFLINKNFVLYKVLFDIFIFLNSYLIYSIVCKKYGQEVYKGLLSSITYLCIVSMPWANSEYSEIMSSTFIGISFYLFLNEKFKKVNYFFVGLFFGISTLINVGSAIFIFGFILPIFIYFKPSLFQRIGYFTLGVISIHTLILLIYFFNDLIKIYLTTLVKIPLSYSTTDFFFFYEFRVFIEDIFNTNIFLFIMFLILTTSILNILNDKEQLFFISFQTFNFLFFISLGIIFYYLAAKGFYHHLIYFLFFLPLAIVYIKPSNLLIIFSISFVMTFATYNVDLFKSSILNITNTEKIYDNYPLRQISEEISSNFDEEFRVLSLDQILILFYLDKNNDVYIVHPTNHNEYFILDNLSQGNLVEEDYLRKSINSNPNVLICSTNDKEDLFYSIESINDFYCSEEFLKSYYFFDFEQLVHKRGEYYPQYNKKTKVFINP